MKAIVTLVVLVVAVAFGWKVIARFAQGIERPDVTLQPYAADVGSAVRTTRTIIDPSNERSARRTLQHLAEEIRPDYQMMIAFDEPTKEGVLMDVLLTSAMAANDPPDGNTTYNSVWKKWIGWHFEIKDKTGAAVPLGYVSKSKRIVGSRGTSDVGFLRATVPPSEEFMLRYTPIDGGKKVYQGKILAPSEAKDKTRYALARVDEES